MHKFVDTMLVYCFHLPTMITLAILSVILLWGLVEVNLDVGDGFMRFSSNQGQINLYWMNGCCDLDW